jgi:SPP1 family phage portal protein
MNIQSMYSDIDIDANDTETEYQAAFDEILWFVDAHLANTGHGNFEKENVNIIFNRDILINEGEIIDNCSKSMGILSLETVIGQHPWVDDPKKEMERIEEQKKKEQEEALSNFDLFGQRGQNPDDKGDEPDPDDDKGGD